MARTRTLAQLRAEVRDRADIENSLHITDAQINRYVNQSAAALHAQMVEACEDYFSTSVTFNTAPDTLGYAVADDVYKIFAVLCPESPGVASTRVVRCKRYEYADVERLTHCPAPTGYDNPPHYATPGGSTGDSRISLLPAPQSVFAVTVVYAPAYADLVADGDEYNGQDGWEEWVVLDAAVKCLVKEETDPRPVAAERDRCEARIMKQIRSVDLAAPHRVQDAGRRLDEWWPARRYY